MSGLLASLRRHRVVLAVGFDLVAWLAAFAVFAWLRLDTDAAVVPWGWVVGMALATAALSIAWDCPSACTRGVRSTAASPR